MGLFVYIDIGLKSETDFEVMYLGSQPGAKLLDVGCGSGKFLMRMKELGWQSEGTEMDPKAVEFAKSNGLSVRLGELQDQKYPENYFDAIVLNSVVEHVLEPLPFLLECHRILKNEGILVILTPNIKSRIHNIYKDKWFPLDPPRHLHIFLPENLKALIQKSGFGNIKIQTTSRNLRSSLLGSQDIKNKGRHQMGGSQPFSAKVEAKISILSSGHFDC